MNSEILPNDYRETLNLIIQKIQLAQQKAVISANITLLDLYWEIGNVILKKKKEQGWGAKVIETLSKDITSAFPGAKGYSSRNLKYMSQFAKTYSNYLDVKDELSKVSWSHNLVLMSKIKDENERNWYINETIKNPYIFDFLTLAKDYKEKDLEDQLVKHITQFLLELGAGFAFVGRQYHLEIGGHDYYIDLLFYHLKLKCYVVIELKTVEFQPEFARKIELLLISSR